MNGVVDVIDNNFKTISISKIKYESYVIAEKQRDDFFDLISIKAKKKRGYISKRGKTFIRIMHTT